MQEQQSTGLVHMLRDVRLGSIPSDNEDSHALAAGPSLCFRRRVTLRAESGCFVGHHVEEPEVGLDVPPTWI